MMRFIAIWLGFAGDLAEISERLFLKGRVNKPKRNNHPSLQPRPLLPHRPNPGTERKQIHKHHIAIGIGLLVPLVQVGCH